MVRHQQGFLLLSVHCVCCSGLHSSMVCSLFLHLLGYIPLLSENIIVKLFYNNIHISVVDLSRVDACTVLASKVRYAGMWSLPPS